MSFNHFKGLFIFAGMEFTYTSIVRNDLDTVWDFIMDYDRRAEWIYFYEKSYVSLPKDGWVGARYKDKLSFLGIPLYIEYKILEYSDRSKIVSHSKYPPFFPTVTVTAKDLGDGRIQSTLVFDIKLGPFRFLPKKMLTKKVNEFIQPAIDKYVAILDKP